MNDSIDLASDQQKGAAVNLDQTMGKENMKKIKIFLKDEGWKIFEIDEGNIFVYR